MQVPGAFATSNIQNNLGVGEPARTKIEIELRDAGRKPHGIVVPPRYYIVSDGHSLLQVTFPLLTDSSP